VSYVPYGNVDQLMSVRMNIRSLSGDYDRTEDDIKALQSVGQIIGEVLKQLDEERCELPLLFCHQAHASHCESLKWTSICRVVPPYSSCGQSKLAPSRNVDKTHVQLKQGVRVSLDMTTLTIMRILPREVDPMVRLISPPHQKSTSRALLPGHSSELP
jgi:26S proteasome regulatory subunit T4